MSDTDLLVQIANDIGELKGDVRALVNSQSAHAERLNGHSTRLTSLERDRSWVKGGLAVCALAWGALTTWFSTR